VAIKYTADAYVDDVLAGRQVACKWVRLACERHRRDLQHGRERGLYFDEKAAKMVIAFFSVLRHSKGEWAGKPVHLEPWQQFWLWVVFGWKRADGTRRFRTSYLEVARKNGKSTLAAGIGLYLMAADNEPGAEVYTAATKKDQAKITHGEATRMVQQSPELKREVNLFRDNISSRTTFSKYEPLGADSGTLDGLNIHGVIADEVHAWKGRQLWDVLETATGARRQPLMVAITTAGFDRQSLCYQLHDYAEKVLSQVIEDDSYFGLIFTLDGAEKDEEGRVIKKADNWEDERVWVKANPNLDVSKKRGDIQQKAERAKNMPAAQNAFLRLEMNVWTQASELWVDPMKWRACGHIPPGFEGNVETAGIEQVMAHMERYLRGRQCYGALDLSSNIDISAWVLVFPPEEFDEPYWVLCRFFIPEDNIEARVRRDRVPYDAWQRQGLLTATPGNVIDYDFILAQVDEDAQAFDIQEVGFDRWGASAITTKLQDKGGEDWVVPIGQGFASMASPMKQLERLILGAKLGHGGHPILTWMAANLVATSDPAGNLKPDKMRSREKIDGMLALLMGIDRAVREEDGESVYEERELLVI
jgi:phage terminase large subunit-like protein